MYAILIDWIVEIGAIEENTLCLAIHILDEYIQKTLIRRSSFQLVGCTCLLIAAKLEQIQVNYLFYYLFAASIHPHSNYNYYYHSLYFDIYLGSFN